MTLPDCDAAGFALRYEAALSELSAAAMSGSDDAALADPALDRFRGYFPQAREPDGPWDLGNVLHMLGPEFRSWRHIRVDAIPGVGARVSVDVNEFPAALGVIRQVIGFAGGRVTEEEP